LERRVLTLSKTKEECPRHVVNRKNTSLRTRFGPRERRRTRQSTPLLHADGGAREKGRELDLHREKSDTYKEKGKTFERRPRTQNEQKRSGEKFVDPEKKVLKRGKMHKCSFKGRGEGGRRRGVAQQRPKARLIRGSGKLHI